MPPPPGLPVPRPTLAGAEGGPPLSRILVNHLTRRSPTQICIAGIDIDEQDHLRPVCQRHLLTDLLAEEGGAFQVGAVVDLGESTPDPDPPFIEDQRFDPDTARAVEKVEPGEYPGLLDQVALNGLRRAFGPDLERRRTYKFATDVGLGTRSLAVVRLREKSPSMVIDGYGKPQLRFFEEDLPTRTTVTDLRFYEDDRDTGSYDVVNAVDARLRAGVQAWAMFGLARPWRVPGDDAKRNWLQLNGLCLADDPLGP